MPPTVTPCIDMTFSWSGGVPQWILSYQISKGPIGDESSLSGPIQEIFTADELLPVFTNFDPDASEYHTVVMPTLSFIHVL
jgi:hypothetical protein